MKENPGQIRSVKELVQLFAKGRKIKYVFFWGHRQKRKSEIDKSCLSNWFASKFELNGVVYPTTEYYMMAQKAKLFGDEEIYKKIISSKSSKEAKSLGRKVKDFNEAKWAEHRFDIVVEGNYAKFSQNPELKKFLLTTGSKVLVEASPVDKIWGVGLAHDNEKIENPILWNGLNLLGFALMEVREKLKMKNGN